MSKSQASGDSVGKLFEDKDGNVWRQISYCFDPSATFEKVGAKGFKIGGSIYSPNVTQFTRLPTEIEKQYEKLLAQIGDN